MLTIEERVAKEWETANLLPPDEREQALDILAIKHGPAIRAALRAEAIAASPNVIALADRRRSPRLPSPDPLPPSAA
jgi:hypothetical protein